MSLEEKIAAHTAATEALTDAVQQLCATIRGATVAPKPAPAPAPAAVPPPGDAAEGKPAAAPKASKPAPAPKAPLAKANTASTPATAPAAAAGSDPLDLGDEGDAVPEATLEDLQAIVPVFAEKHGRTAAVAIFSQLGHANGKELVAKAPELIGKAVALFRASL